jgi:hypothetical protein
METRIKNTPEELSNYSEALNKYLDRIFDEFGLIICGWSAEWDEALRNTLYRRENRRFSIYWTVREQLGDEATRLVTHLKAEKISITGADGFFSTLSDNIEALTDFGASHPLSTDLAVAKVKKYLSEEKYSIKLHDLVMKELDRVCLELSSDRFETKPQLEVTHEFYIKRIHEYEELMSTLIKISITLVYHDNGKCSNLIKNIIERVMEYPRNYGLDALIYLQQYPALLLADSIGVVSLYSHNYDALATIFLKSQCYDSITFLRKKKINLLEELYRYSLLRALKNTEISNPENYIVKIIGKYIDEYLPSNSRYEDVFDTFEYLIGMIYIGLKRVDFLTGKTIAPGYRLAKKYYSPFHSDEEPEFIYDFIEEGLKEGKEWSLLKAGFFNGSPEKLEEFLLNIKNILRTGVVLYIDHSLYQ